MNKRCPRCDRAECTMVPGAPWPSLDEQAICLSMAVDWRARALAAEAALDEKRIRLEELHVDFNKLYDKLTTIERETIERCIAVANELTETRYAAVGRGIIVDRLRALLQPVGQSELIQKMKEATEDAKNWPDSMKKMHEIRQKADTYFHDCDDDEDCQRCHHVGGLPKDGK